MANLINLLIRILIMQNATKTADDDTDTGDSGVKPQAAEVVEKPVVLSKTKIAAISLTITSAVLMTNTENKEGYREKPYPDTAGVPTVGIGTTVYPDGSKVKLTDPPVSKEQARYYLKAHLDKQGQMILNTLKRADGSYVELSQDEWDIIQDFTYQYGIGNWSKSSMLKHYHAGEYIQACHDYLKYKYAGGKDCSIRSNGCYGVWTRQKWRFENCIAANN